MVTTATVCAIASFLLGGVPFGLLLGKLKGIDIRTIGSGNIGATNVTRALGRRWGITAFLLDFLKGLIPVVATGAILAASSTTPPVESPAFGLLEAKILSGVAAVLGHIFPVYLRFRGGKGVATTFGVMSGLMWLPTLIAGVTWLAVFLKTRVVALASIASVVVLPIAASVYFRFFGDDPSPRTILTIEIVTVAMAAVIVFRHRENLKRLLRGQENRF